MPIDRHVVRHLWKFYTDLVAKGASGRSPKYFTASERRELMDLGIQLTEIWASRAARILSQKQSFDETDDRQIYQSWTYRATARGTVGIRGEVSRHWGP